jgi:hypothetical protein
VAGAGCFVSSLISFTRIGGRVYNSAHNFVGKQLAFAHSDGYFPGTQARGRKSGLSDSEEPMLSRSQSPTFSLRTYLDKIILVNKL